MTDQPKELPSISNLPDRIYLAFGLGDGETADFLEMMSDRDDSLEDIPWSRHKVDDCDPEYVRADIAQARAESLEAENSNLKMLLARYVDHVRDYEGVDFLDTMPDQIRHEILEITKQALGESGVGE